jgi:hypothetical protein
MNRFYDTLIVGAAFVAFGVFAGYQADRDVEITAAHVKEADERKADMPPADRIYPFALPIQYDATVAMGSGRTRFYARSHR